MEEAMTRWWIPVRNKIVKVNVQRTKAGWFIKESQNDVCCVKGSNSHRAVEITVSNEVIANITATEKSATKKIGNWITNWNQYISSLL